MALSPTSLPPSLERSWIVVRNVAHDRGKLSLSACETQVADSTGRVPHLGDLSRRIADEDKHAAGTSEAVAVRRSQRQMNIGLAGEYQAAAARRIWPHFHGRIGFFAG